jgi:hypothetical protein
MADSGRVGESLSSPPIGLGDRPFETPRLRVETRYTVFARGILYTCWETPFLLFRMGMTPRKDAPPCPED